MSHSGFLPFKHEDWQGEVSASAKANLDEILSLLKKDSSRQFLKTGSSRKVWVEESSIGPLCVKEYLYPKATDHWVRLLRGSRAYREWVRLRVFDEGNVPIPAPLLWVESKDPEGGVRSLVITRFIEDSQTLDQVLSSDHATSSRWKVARSAGEALAKMHSIGARHDDLHAGNLLVHECEGFPQVLIMDLHEVKLRRNLTWSARLRNLATLYGALRWKLTLREKHHALKGYLCTLTDWKPPFRSELEARISMGRALEKMGRDYYRWRCRKRIQKCLEHGKRFNHIEPGEYRGWIRAEWNTPSLVERLKEPNDWIKSEDCVVLKHTPTTTVVRASIGETHPDLFLKRYNRKDWWEKTKNLFRHSRSMKVWRAGYGLEVMGIPTPKTIAMIEKRNGPILLESFILTEWTDGGVGLDDFWNERSATTSTNPMNREERIALRKKVAEIFLRLHDLRISHGDLKGRNILLKSDSLSPYSPQFVDLDAIQFNPVRFKRSRVNDLSRLLFSVYSNAPVLTQARFFKEYCGEDRQLWEQRRDWWKRIGRRTKRKLREKGLIQ